MMGRDGNGLDQLRRPDKLGDRGLQRLWRQTNKKVMGNGRVGIRGRVGLSDKLQGFLVCCRHCSGDHPRVTTIPVVVNIKLRSTEE